MIYVTPKLVTLVRVDTWSETAPGDHQLEKNAKVTAERGQHMAVMGVCINIVARRRRRRYIDVVMWIVGVPRLHNLASRMLRAIQLEMQRPSF